VVLGPGQGAAEVVVWLGDSTAAGVGATDSSMMLPEQVAALLGQRIRLTVLAHSGDRVSDVVHNQLPKVAALAPGVVFISVGANDVTHLTSAGRFRHQYGRLLDGLPPSVKQVVVLGIPDMGAPPRLAEPLRAVAGWRGRSLDAEVRALARDHQALYVNIAASTGPAFRGHRKQYFARDGYHPNDAGYGLWARAVASTGHMAILSPS
jgi:lysophospholipase L1-like esterase